MKKLLTPWKCLDISILIIINAIITECQIKQQIFTMVTIFKQPQMHQNITIMHFEYITDQ
jgi:hypothetical protein